MKKDYSLLRPFNLEAAKRGEPICFSSGAEITRFIDGPDSVGDLVFVVPDGQFYITRKKAIRMAPICWVEGRPVYRGDVLYRKGLSGQFIAESIERDSDGDVFLRYANGGGSSWVEGPEDTSVDCTWTPLKVKREGWVNIYPKYSGGIAGVGSYINETRENADAQADNHRIACVRIEWEE